MKKFSWRTGTLVVVAVVLIAVVGAIFTGPAIYKALRGGDDSTATAITLGDAEAALGALDGTWSVVPGTAPNTSVAGYTVAEILNGEPVTVVGTTDQVSGTAQFSGTTLTSAAFEARTTGLGTDNSARDFAARSARILDSEGYPISTLVVSTPVELSSIPDDGTPGTVTMTVDLTIKKSTIRRSIDVTVLRSAEQIIVSGAIPVTWADVDVTAPSLGFVTVEPSGTVDFRVVLEQRI